MHTFLIDVYRGNIFRFRAAQESTGPLMALLALVGHNPLRRVMLQPTGVLTAEHGPDKFIVRRCDDAD